MITNTIKINFILIVSGILVSLLFLDHLFFLIPIVLILFLNLVESKSTITVLLFASLITLSSGLGQNLRLLIQICTIVILLIIFLKLYGLQITKFPKLPSQIINLVAFIFLSMIFSLVFTKYFELGFQQLIRSVLFFFIVYLFYSLLNNYNDIKYFIYALFFSAIIYFLMLLYVITKADFDFINLNQNILSEEGISFVHRNVMGGFFSICIAFIITFISSPNTYKRYKKYLIIFVFFLILSLILTNSRGAIFSLVCSSIYVLYKQNRKILRYLLYIILFIIPVILFDPILDTINMFFRLEQVLTGRDYILETIYNIILNNPIIGAGPAGTKFEMYNNMPYLLGSPEELILSRHINQIEFGHAHNFYLFLYTDLGIPGLIASFLIPIVFFNLSNRLINELKNNKSSIYSITLGIQASGIALFVRGIFEWSGIFSYGTITYDLPFWWIFSLLVFLYQKIIINKISL